MRSAAVRALLSSVLLALLGSALAIAYTVQVIAVSDQDSALSISRELLREGYPAYVVRSTGAQGDVFRVRVGAFANRAAALRYAESMPEVAGSRPVPALAEAIPQGIMPLAPRLLWQGEAAGYDVRVLPWPAGLALRLQPTDPLRQAHYLVFQDGEERRFDAWAAVPLRRLPAPSAALELDVPIVDLTAPPSEVVDDADESAADGDAPPAVASTEPDGERDPLAEALAALAEPSDDEREAGVMLLRDRSLWPPSWQEDDDEVRGAYRISLTTIVARELGLEPERVASAAYFPAGEPPPALVVLDVSGPTGSDTGQVLALADPSRGVRLGGPEAFVGTEPSDGFPAWPVERVRVTDAPPEGGLGGEAWQVRSDGGFVRITLPDGATWRAGVGTPLWSDGQAVLAWDGERLLLYDFVQR